MQGAVRTVPEHTGLYVRNGSAAATPQMALLNGSGHKKVGAGITPPLHLALVPAQVVCLGNRTSRTRDDVGMVFKADTTRDGPVEGVVGKWMSLNLVIQAALTVHAGHQEAQ